MATRWMWPPPARATTWTGSTTSPQAPAQTGPPPCTGSPPGRATPSAGTSCLPSATRAGT
ncbi:MAG: hypothetical protein FJW99_09420 [Actinobacteria bacterium]|nr:hypothetical protein [Actinomycetota bacterium]MBM3697382.1 hypothetical protein [Actinomycetota bacterium]